MPLKLYENNVKWGWTTWGKIGASDENQSAKGIKKKKLLDKVELTYPEENYLTYYRHVIYPLCMKEAKHGKNSSQIKSFRTTYLIIPFSSYNLKFRDLDLSPAQGNKGKTEKA